MSRNCEVCPQLFGSRGVEITGLPPAAEFKEVWRYPYVWVASSSGHKAVALTEALRVIEETNGRDLVDFGWALPFPRDWMKGVDLGESNFHEGVEIVREKILKYWLILQGATELQECRRYNACAENHLLVASDVNVWAGYRGDSWQELRKPIGLEIESRDKLVEHILRLYGQFSGPVIWNQVEAAVGVLIPNEGWQDYRLAVGSSVMFVQLPLDLLKDREFVEFYVDYAAESSGGVSSLLSVAGGMLTDYLLSAVVLWRKIKGVEEKVVVELVPDDRLTKEELILVHARGFPPRLVWKLLNRARDGGDGGLDNLKMEPNRELVEVEF